MVAKRDNYWKGYSISFNETALLDVMEDMVKDDVMTKCFIYIVCIQHYIIFRFIFL